MSLHEKKKELKMTIYEPAMCCPTGLCGVGIDKELLRISTVISSLEKNGVKAERFNLTNSPQEFINNQEVTQLMMDKGVEILPITIVDNKMAKTGSYPTNEEIMNFLAVPSSFLIAKSTDKDDNLFKTIDRECGGEGCC